MNFKGLAPTVRDGAEPAELPERSSTWQAKAESYPAWRVGYATALFELALAENALDAVKADLDRFDALVADSADLARLVRSPVFAAEEQLKALAAVLDKAGIGGLAAKFLRW